MFMSVLNAILAIGTTIIKTEGVKMREIQMPELTCLKCGYKWHPRGSKVYLCPKCHSYKWDEQPTPAEPIYIAAEDFEKKEGE